MVTLVRGIGSRLAPRGRQLLHTSSTWLNKSVCKCPTTRLAETVVTALQNRRWPLDALKCKELKAFEFRHNPQCKLSHMVASVAADVLRGFSDVIHVDPTATVYLESLQPEPPGELSSLTGDYGKALKQFVIDCRENDLLEDIGSIIDIGGQGSATVQRVAKALGREAIPSLIVDINALVPTTSEEKEGIAYAIMDGEQFFTNLFESEKVQEIVDGGPTLCLFNNLLNVLSPEKGWSLIKAAWEKLHPNDYLLISGLDAETLEEKGFVPGESVGGISSMHKKDGDFYKSALRESFAQCLEQGLPQINVELDEVFSAEYQQGNRPIGTYTGRRLCAIQKGA